MNYLSTGNFFGHNDRTIALDGITITETAYDYEFVDWHYHENPHFTFITHGNIRQGTRRGTLECSSDTLLFHNSQEPHYNVKPAGITRGFQIEVAPPWYGKFAVDLNKLPPIANITQPNARLLFYNIYKEARMLDEASTLTIDSLLLETFDCMLGIETLFTTTPRWVKRADEILRERFDRPLSLLELSSELNIHWAHLSREFRRYFRCNFSQYVRKVRVEKSLALLRKTDLSIAEIALTCGFSDQSHFNRCFKEFTGITPRAFRRVAR
jgi:AraC family transcriptional regulator